MPLIAINPYYKTPAEKVVINLAGQIDALFHLETSAKSYTINQLKDALPDSAADINKRNVIQACAFLGFDWKGDE